MGKTSTILRMLHPLKCYIYHSRARGFFFPCRPHRPLESKNIDDIRVAGIYATDGGLVDFVLVGFNGISSRYWYRTSDLEALIKDCGDGEKTVLRIIQEFTTSCSLK